MKAKPIPDARFRELMERVNQRWVRNRWAFEPDPRASVFAGEYGRTHVKALIAAYEDKSRETFTTSAREAWAELSLLAAYYMEHGGAPKELTAWATDVFEDQLRPKGERPKQPPPRRDSGKRGRDKLVCTAIYDLVKNCGLPPTRSTSRGPECSAFGGSAADVVGAVWFGTDPKSFKNTERIWAKRDKRMFDGK